MTNNIAALNESAISTFTTLKKEVQPFALRFEKFAVANHLDRFMKMELSSDWAGDRYDVDISGPSAGGVNFTLHEEYFGDSYTYFFAVPYAYFEDPDAWEADALRHAENLTKKAIAAFVKIFPKFETDPALKALEFEIVAAFPYNADPLATPEFFDYRFKKDDGYFRNSHFVYDEVEYDMYSFRYELSTNSVFYRGYFDKSTDDAMTVITRPVTVEERAAEKAAVEARIEQRRQDSIRRREERIEAERQRSAESRAESRAKKEQKRIEKQARHEENMRQKALAEARKAEQGNKE